MEIPLVIVNVIFATEIQIKIETVEERKREEVSKKEIDNRVHANPFIINGT